MDISTFSELFERYDTIVLLDTETTGFDQTREQIIELAATALKADGSIQEMDDFVSLHVHETLPEKVIELTGITDEQLASEGKPEEEVINKFLDLFGERTLLVAYNAQFDVDFIAHTVMRSARERLCVFNTADYLDIFTVARDRKGFPNKLCDMIDFYHITDAENSHRAIDDVRAMISVINAMKRERNDVFKYVNLFGFNPKYGLPERRYKKVTYFPQPYGKPKLPYEILPYKAGTWKFEKKE